MLILASAVELDLGDKCSGNVPIPSLGMIEDADDRVGVFLLDRAEFGDVVRGWVSVAHPLKGLRKLGMHQCDEFSVVAVVLPPALFDGDAVDIGGQRVDAKSKGF